LTTFRHVAEIRRRAAGYWTKAIIEIGIDRNIRKFDPDTDTDPDPDSHTLRQ
jgi:hypothetical protein